MNKLTNDRAVRRYLQVRSLQQTVERVEAAIAKVEQEIDEAETRRHDLRKEKSALQNAIREAAKDEGQLPLFDELLDDLIEHGIPREYLPSPGMLS